MSEARRVSFTTIGSMASAGNSGSIGSGNFLAPNALPATNAVRFGTDLFAEPPKTDASASPTATQRKTVRLTLELSPTDKETYPEINYAKLMRLEEKKRKKLKQKINGASSSSMPFEDNDDDVARIAEELEKKYGCAYGRGRGRSKRDDHCDIGMGYDESDSFIDNTDAYDENIPEEVETVEGGFYINCGALEFKQLNTETVKLKTDEIIKMPSKSRKRILSLSTSSDDSSSSENEETTLTNDKNEQNDSESSGSTSKSKITNNNSMKRLKKEKSSKMTKKAIQHNGKKKEKTNTTSITAGISVSTSNSPKPATVLDETASDGSDKDRGAARQKTVKTTTVKDMLKAKRDSFLKMQVGGGEAGKSANGELRGATSKSSDDESSDSSEDDDSKTESDSNQSAPVAQDKLKSDEKSDNIHNPLENSDKLRSTDTKLPELDVEVITNIQSFKDLVKTKNITGKRFQFDEELTEIFLRIDETLLCIDKPQRNMVFAHLEYHLLLPKYFFLRKAKQLRVKMEKLKTQRALGKLRKAVIEAMPGVIANYEIEVRKYTELQATNPNTSNTIKLPKKKFPWNSNIRNLLYDVYQTRWISYPVLCTRKESLEDFITVYLKDKVVEIWPNGWMSFEELQKEIEKRKQANKKAKEKKTENSNYNIVSTASISTTTTTTTSSVLTTATTTTILSSYAKQFEEFASSRSCGNSDNDSVASSNTSNGSSLKRKINTEEIVGGKKVKIPKNIINITTTNNSNGTLSTAKSSTAVEEPQQLSNVVASTVTCNDLTKVVDTDCPTYPITVQATTALTPSTITGVVISNSHQDILIHSNILSSTKQAAHIIDLDKYNSASDILEKSKQLQKASTVNATSPSLESVLVQAQLKPKLERTNSSDSDGVEIVGIFQANENPAAASKVRSKKSQQLQLQQNSSVKATALYNNNNNNKKLSSGISNSFDVNTALSALKDLERSQHSKPKNSAVSTKETIQ